VDAPSGTLLTNTSYFELLVDVATVRQLKVDAETAKTDAETAQTGAEAALASFQGQYKSAAANPYGGAEDVGDLWYDETANILKYYTGSAFEPVTTSLATVTDNYLTISNQVITAGTVPVSLGGTGATTASGARTALGVDAAGTDNSTDVTLAGSLDYLTISGQAITRNAIDLTTDVTGALPVANGGTGATSASAARTALGLGSAATSNTSAFEASGAVSTHAAVTSSVHGISAFGATLVDDADAATARTTLGLGTAATTAASAYATAAQGTTADSALQDVVDDTTPQLGGDLDVNGNSIVSASNGNIAITPNGTGNVSLGNFTFDADQTVGAGQDNYVLTYDHSTTSISLEAAAGGGGGGVSDGDKGDITVSGSGATWTIDSAAVTYAKIQNVSATDKLLGRSTAGAGSIEEISCTSAGRALLDDADSAAQRTTLGLGTAALSASGDFETAGAVSTHAALTSSVHGISSFGATLVDDADASAARTTLGLGTISTQASNSVSITGGSVTGITDLAIADGGTGASTASVARGNLGLEIGVDVQQYDADTTKNDVANTFTANQIISVTDNTNAALRITQTGTGNALVVEDSTNPDATPFVVDASGKLLVGTSTARSNLFNAGVTSLHQVETLGGSTVECLAVRNANDTTGADLVLAKSRGTAIGSNTIVQSGDRVGTIAFMGSDGSEFVQAARINAEVDGTPGTNDMPGRLVFSTTADGASSPTERMRIDSSGNVLVGKTTQTPSTAGCELIGSGLVNATRDANAPLQLTRLTNDGDIALFRKGGTTVGSIGTSGGRVYIADDSTNGITFSNSSAIMWPSNSSGGVVDNTMDIGSSSFRFNDIYLGNEPTVTSDQNEKQDIEELTEAEQRVAVACKGLLRKYRWKSAVAKKGDEARIHFGIIAQDLQAAFEAEGLDAGRYGMFMSNTWWETSETYTDDEGIEQTRTITYNTAEEAPEGAVERTRLGVRYSELLAFIIAAI